MGTWFHAILYLLRCVLGMVHITDAESSGLQPPPSDTAKIIGASRARKLAWCRQPPSQGVPVVVSPRRMARKLMRIKDANKEPLIKIKS